MSNTHFTGPILAIGRGRPSGPSTGLGEALDYNPDSPAPGGQFEYCMAMLDVRQPFAYQPGQAADAPFEAYLGGMLTLIDQAPSTIAVDNIAASNTMTAATPLTLVSVSGAGITVGASVVNALTGATVTGLLAIDGAMGVVNPTSSAKGLSIWDPTKAISRAVSLTSTDNLSGVNFTIAGYDLYGYPLTQTRAGPNNNTVNTLKAFKYIVSITPDATNAGHLTVGTSDIFGLPLRADAFGYTTIYWNNALITASTGFVAAVATNPSTALIGDVRGTYAVQSASDGTKAMQLFWRPKVANISPSGVWGQAQV